MLRFRNKLLRRTRIAVTLVSQLTLLIMSHRLPKIVTFFMMQVCPDNEIEIQWIESICDEISELYQITMFSFIQAIREDIATQLRFHPEALLPGRLFRSLRDLKFSLRIPLVEPLDHGFAFIATKLAYTLYQRVFYSAPRAATENIDVFLHNKSDIFEAEKKQRNIPKTPPRHSSAKRIVHPGYAYPTLPASLIRTDVLPIPVNFVSPQSPLTMAPQPAIATKREPPVQKTKQITRSHIFWQELLRIFSGAFTLSRISM